VRREQTTFATLTIEHLVEPVRSRTASASCAVLAQPAHAQLAHAHSPARSSPIKRRRIQTYPLQPARSATAPTPSLPRRAFAGQSAWRALQACLPSPRMRRSVRR